MGDTHVRTFPFRFEGAGCGGASSTACVVADFGGEGPFATDFCISPHIISNGVGEDSTHPAMAIEDLATAATPAADSTV